MRYRKKLALGLVFGFWLTLTGCCISGSLPLWRLEGFFEGIIDLTVEIDIDIQADPQWLGEIQFSGDIGGWASLPSMFASQIEFDFQNALFFQGGIEFDIDNDARSETVRILRAVDKDRSVVLLSWQGDEITLDKGSCYLGWVGDGGARLAGAPCGSESGTMICAQTGESGSDAACDLCSAENECEPCDMGGSFEDCMPEADGTTDGDTDADSDSDSDSDTDIDTDTDTDTGTDAGQDGGADSGETDTDTGSDADTDTDTDADTDTDTDTDTGMDGGASIEEDATAALSCECNAVNAGGPGLLGPRLLSLFVSEGDETPDLGGKAKEEENQEKPEQEQEEEEEEHEGFFFRTALGIGYSRIAGKGLLRPLPGIERTEDPMHESPALNIAFDFGGGIVDNLALHAGILYERMLIGADDPSMRFGILGIGGGLSYYFTPYDLYLTGQVRLLGMLVFMPDVVCVNFFADKYEWYGGPGFSVTLGKEWFGDNDRGLGVGIQGNLYLFRSDELDFNYFSILAVLTVTRF